MVLETSKMDLKRQRLKCMLSNAILEMWKKETGSLSSVIIEGTICITSGNGKTIVLQVADKYFGSVPGSDSLTDSYGSGNGYRNSCNGTMPWPVVSPTGTVRDEGYHETESDSSGTINCTSKTDDAKDDEDNDIHSPQSAKKAKVSESSTLDTSDSSEKHNSPVLDKVQKLDPKFIERDENFNTPMGYGVGDYCPGTGYYTCKNSEKGQEETQPIKREMDSNKSGVDHGESDGELTIDTGAADDQLDHSKDNAQEEEKDDPDRGAMDLSRKDGDLSVMSPQNYTAQVRNVIRQKLLAAGKTSPEEQSGKEVEERETPQPLKSLGLHRSPTSESDEESSPTEPHRSWPLLAINNVVNQVGTKGLPPHPILNGMGHFPMLSPTIPASAMGHLYNTPTGIPHNFSNNLKRKAPMMPPLVPFPPQYPVGMMPMSLIPPTSPLLTPPLPLASPNSQSSKDASPVSPTGSNKESDKDSTSPDQRVYQCDFCSKTFLFKSKYHEHLPVHTNARPFQCHLCARTYKYKYDLRVHLRTHMGIPTKSTVCPFCTTKFDTNKQLRLHIKESHKEQQKVSEEECTDPKDNLPPAL